jgi:thymidylate kinase
VTVQAPPTERHGLLVAAEGFEGSATSEGIDSLARWLERRGRRVRVVTWPRSRLVARAGASPRGRLLLTPRVVAALAGADAARHIAHEIEPPLARGEVVLCDRYAWTAVAREIARGVDPDWVSALYRFAPRPDLVILHRQSPSGALAHAIGSGPSAERGQAVAGDFGRFLKRMATAYDRLAAEAAVALPDRGRHGPWPTDVVVLETPSSPTAKGVVRDALLRLFADAPAAAAT